MSRRPDVIVVLTDQERAPPPYEGEALQRWRGEVLTGRRWFAEHGVSFERHYTGSLACVPSRPTLLTGHYPDVHGVTQTDGMGKQADDPRMRWLRPGEVPTLGHWFGAGGYDTHYDGKWHVSHADLADPETGERVVTNTGRGVVLPGAVRNYLDANPLGPFGFSGWVGPEPHGADPRDLGLVRDPLIAARVVAWLEARYRAGAPAMPPRAAPSCWSRASSTRTTSASSRRGRPGARSAPRRAIPRTYRRRPPSTRIAAGLPAAQVAFRAAYLTAYGPAFAVDCIYRWRAQAYRDLYYRLHAEVDGPIDRVRRAVTEGGSDDAVLVRTADHGELLGAHGGQHQKWGNLYDEATRVPFVIAGIGAAATRRGVVADVPTCHVESAAHAPRSRRARPAGDRGRAPPLVHRGARSAGTRPDAARARR